MYFGLNKYVKLSSLVSSKGCEQLLQKSHVHKVTGDHVCPSTVTGLDYLTDSRLNKGLAYTIEERQTLGIHGLLPCSYRSQEAQVHLCKQIFEGYKKDLNKYVYLNELLDRNEKLYYRLVGENIKAMLPIVYTPTVGVACQKFGLIFTRPRGLFISLNDKGHIYDVIRNWPEPDVRAIVVTDGERILGLGDLGAFGMGIPVGKLSLYTALAGIKPHQCLPMLIDVGTNNEALLNNLEYIGLRQKRATGKEYDEFLDEFMASVVRRYGQNTLIQFEDFGNQNAFRLLEKYRNTYCTFNDDIQGTAAVALGGLFAAQRLTGKKISQHRILFFGAGGAGAGIANLCIKAMMSEGLTSKQAYDNVWLVDVDGLLTTHRPREKFIEFQIPFATDHEPMASLHEIIKEFKPSTLIGVSASTGAFTPEILLDMANINERPIVFALSNPTSKAECTAQDAYEHTGGKVIYSSGSPFPPVQYNNKEYVTGQGNNAYIFPGIALGVILSRCHHIPEDIFLIAARCLSEHVTDEQVNSGSVFPPLDLIRELSVDLATRVVEFAYQQGLSSVYPEPRNKLEWVKGQMYNYNYYTNMPRIWRYPDGPYEKQP